MATTAQRLIIDTENGRLVGAFAGVSGVTVPTFTLGDTCPIELYLVRQPGVGQALTSIPFPAGATIRTAIGVVNAQPTSGSWAIGYGANVATGLAFDITAAELETELNGLASVTAAGGVTVDKVGGQYRISWVTVGDKLPFVPGSNTLVPASDAQVQTLQEGGASTNEVVMLNLAVRPIGLTSTFADLDPVASSHTATSYSITGAIRGGGYKLQLQFQQDGVTTSVWTDTITIGASTDGISRLIYETLVNENWGFIEGNATTNAWGLLVTQVEGSTFNVDFTAPQFTTAVSVTAPSIIGIDVSGVLPLEGKSATIGLNTVEAVAFLGTEESRRAVLEVEVEDLDGVQTLLQTPCTLVGQVIYEGAFAAVPLETPMSEAVANARFLRRDADQTLDTTSKNQLWENLLGVTAPTGVDVVAAINGANDPAASNVFATMADLDGIFDQNLNSTDAVNFTGITIAGQAQVQSFKVHVGGVDKLTINTDGEINTAAAAILGAVQVASFTSAGAINLSGPSLDTVLAHDSLSFQGISTLTPGSLSLHDGTSTTVTVDAILGVVSLTNGANTVSLDANAGLTFATANALSDAVHSAATVLHSGGVGHIDAADYPDEVRVVINGVTYAMPARAI